MPLIFSRLEWRAETGTGQANGAVGTVPSKHGPEKIETMKKATFMKIVATLAIGAAFPLGAIAAPQAKTTTSKDVVQKVKTEKVKAPEAKPPRKHFFAHPWLES
jgi:hypothetical protein